MNWKDFLILAEELTKPSCSLSVNEDARMRTAISKSYYYLFLSSRDWLVSQRIAYRKPSKLESHGEHGDLIDYLKNNLDTDLRYLGNRLDSLSQNRIYADYREDITISGKNTAKELWESHSILVYDAERIIRRRFTS